MEFRLLGPLEVVEDDRSLTLGGHKQRSLLAILLLSANDVVPAERLIDELWGESPTPTAPKALQGYVSQLRKQLGEGRLLTREPGYVLQVDPSELDVARFESLVAARRLPEALAMWRGSPLADFAYEPFAQAPIARLEELHLAAIELRIDADLASGRHGELVGELESLARDHPLRERLQGQLMLCLYRSGRQAEALEAYQATRSALIEELGIEPGRELRDLHQAILQQDPDLELRMAPEPAVEATAAFIGRKPELAALLGGLDDAFASRGRVFLLAGEPGIGKSRLAEELIAHATARGARVLVGRCWEAGGAPAYWPWVQSLRTYMRDVETSLLRELLGDGAADLAQIVPELRRHFPGLPHPPALESQAARFRLFDATAEFLRRASAAQPIVVVIDDLHGADEPSLMLLQFLARELGSTRVLLVGAYRDVDPVPSRRLIDALAEIARESVARRLSLGGLSEQEVAEFVELAGPELVTADRVARLRDETEGNPLFVGEIVRLLSVEGRLAIPQTVRDVIARRLSHLSDDCHGLLVHAAVLGRDFAVDALVRLTDAPEDDVLGLLDEALAAQVIGDVPGSPDQLRFAHMLIRDTLYDGLTSARRIQMHRRVVEVLEALYGDEPGPHLAELAHHSSAGNDFGKALLYARIAGDRALALIAYEEAARLYELAHEALDVTRPGDSAARAELLLAAGDALLKAGSLERAKTSYLAAADLARAANLPEHLGRAALGYGGRFVWQRAWDDRGLVPLLEEALAAVGDENLLLRAQLLARSAGARRGESSLEPRSSLSREAVRLARQVGDKNTLCYALVGQFMATWGPDIGELVDMAGEVTGLAEETGVPERELEAVTLQSITRWTLADSDVEAVNEQYGVFVDRLKQPAQRWLADMVFAAWALFQGRLEEAEALTDRAVRSGPHSADARCSYCLAMFVLRRDQGRLAETESLIRSAVGEFPGYSTFPCYVALLECELGHTGAARDALAALAADDFAALPRDDEWLYCMALLAEAAAHLDDRERAATIYRLLAPYAGLNALVSGEVSLGSVARYLGIVATTTCQWDDAVTYFEQAIETNARMGARPWLARTHHDYARMLLAADRPGDRERAGAALAAARALYEELGMTSYAASAQAVADSAS